MPSKTTAYLRVSTGGQDLDQQKLAILDYARRHRTPVADFVEVHGSAGSPAQREQLLRLIDTLQPGDRLTLQRHLCLKSLLSPAILLPYIQNSTRR